MDQLLSAYLFQNNTLSLGKLGQLRLLLQPAHSDFGNKQLLAPAEEIVYEETEATDSHFIPFVAARLHCTETEAQQRFDDYIRLLEQGMAGGTAGIKGLGHFSKSNAGNWQFMADPLPAVFFPSVTANRVVHPEAEHAMLVGDKETTTTQMAEYFNEEVPVKSRWWVAALVLAAVAIFVIVLYFANTTLSTNCGNAIPYDYFD